jgi:large subunit ribosomal protein L25
MVEQISISGKVRDKTGRGEARRMRRAGFIPAVLYGRGIDTTHLLLKEDEFSHSLHKIAGGNILIDLKIEGETKSRPVIIKEIQQDPVCDRPWHVDLQVVRLDEKIKIKVPVMVKGESPGVKVGGILEHILREIEVECLPRDIPEKIEVNISKLEIGDSIHLKDLIFTSGVVALGDREAAVLSVVPPKAEEKEVPPEEAITEPELIRKEKEEEVEEAGEEATAKEESKKAAAATSEAGARTEAKAGGGKPHEEKGKADKEKK